MYNATELQVALQNHEHRYTVTVYYRSRWLYYVVIPPVVVQYVSAHIDRVMDIRVGYCSSQNQNLTVFHANGLLGTASDEDAATDEDVASAN